MPAKQKISLSVSLTYLQGIRKRVKCNDLGFELRSAHCWCTLKNQAFTQNKSKHKIVLIQSQLCKDHNLWHTVYDNGPLNSSVNTTLLLHHNINNNIHNNFSKWKNPFSGTPAAVVQVLLRDPLRLFVGRFYSRLKKSDPDVNFFQHLLFISISIFYSFWLRTN